MVPARKKVVPVLSFAAVLLLGLLTLCHAAETSCSYLNETFSGDSEINWTANSGSWTVQDGKVRASIAAAGSMGSYAAAFSPADLFSVDVNVAWVSGADLYAGYGIFPYTSGGVYFNVDGHDVSGVGAIVYPNLGKARLLAWDVPAQTWYQSAEYSLPSTVVSIGVAYYGDRVVLRVNRSDTTVAFSGDFSYAAPGNVDTLWLFAQNAGTVVDFDNVCAGSSSQPSQYALTVTKTGSGTGLVQSAPSGIDCGTTCTASYDQGTTVTLTAVADASSVFSGWTGGGCSGTGDCQIQMQSDTSVTAQFEVSQTKKTPLPVGQIVIPYEAGQFPVTNPDPLLAKPVGFGSVAQGDFGFSLKAALGAFAGPVDIYFGLLCPALDPNSIILIKPDWSIGFLHQDGLVPWKSGVREAFEEAALPDLLALNVPSGAWYAYFLVAPKGDLANYYLWTTSFFISYELEAVADRLLTTLGEDGGFDAVVRAVDRGHELWEVVDAAMTGRLSVDGVLTSTGAPYHDHGKRIMPGISTSSLSPQTISDENLSQCRNLCRTAGAELIETRNEVVSIILSLFKQGYSFEQVLWGLGAGGRVSLVCEKVSYESETTQCVCRLGLFEEDCTYIPPEIDRSYFNPIRIMDYLGEYCGDQPAFTFSRGLTPQGGDGPCAETEPVAYNSHYYFDLRKLSQIGVPHDSSKPTFHASLYFRIERASGTLTDTDFSFENVMGYSKTQGSGTLSPNGDQITSFIYSREDKIWSVRIEGGPIPFSHEVGDIPELRGRVYELEGQAVCDAVTQYTYELREDQGNRPAYSAQELECGEKSRLSIWIFPQEGSAVLMEPPPTWE